MSSRNYPTSWTKVVQVETTTFYPSMASWNPSLKPLREIRLFRSWIGAQLNLCYGGMLFPNRYHWYCFLDICCSSQCLRTADILSNDRGNYNSIHMRSILDMQNLALRKFVIFISQSFPLICTYNQNFIKILLFSANNLLPNILIQVDL